MEVGAVVAVLDGGNNNINYTYDTSIVSILEK